MFNTFINGDADTIVTLLDGSSVNVNEIMFDDSDYTFARNGNDITNLVPTPVRRQYWPSYDVTTFNNLSYARTYAAQHGGTPPPVLNMNSTWGNFLGQIENDPLAAPLETLDNTVKQVVGSSGIQTLLIIGLVGVGIYLLIKHESK